MGKTIYALCFFTLIVPALFSAPRYDVINPETWTPASKEYRQYYGWDDEEGSWDWRLRRSTMEDEIALHIWRPSNKKTRGTVFIFHGYLEHSASRAPVAARITADSWLCVAIDLPGHGLSSGPRGEVDDFSRYAAAVEVLAENAAMEAWPRPWIVLAHSTGCAATLSYIAENPCPFDHIIFESPLVRSFLWDLSMFGNAVLGGIIPYLPIRYSVGPSDPAFVSFLKRDPLNVGRYPVSWTRALIQYEKKTHLWPAQSVPLLVLQGEKDSAVDSAYNLPFLSGLFPNIEIQMIPNGGHHLLRGAEQARAKSWGIVNSKLRELLCTYK